MEGRVPNTIFLRTVIARGRSPSSNTQELEIEKQKLPAGNLKSSRKTNNEKDLLTQR